MRTDGPIFSHYIAAFATSPLRHRAREEPWSLTTKAEQAVRDLLAALGPEFRVTDDIAVHESAVVETGATVKGPAVLGPRCFIAAGAYLRGGVWLDEDCVVGPGAEVKSSFLFSGSKLAHFNFVGDSVLGSGVNLEAGSIIANHRNERADKEIRVRLSGRLVGTGCTKFGALLGDGVKVGANAVLAPGTVLEPAQVVPRLSLIDHDPL